MAKNKGYMLPDTIPADEYVPACLSIPNTQQDIAAFVGAIAMLGRWFSWERTADKRGKDAAAQWRTVLAGMTIGEECGNVINCDMLASCLSDSDSVKDAVIELSKVGVLEEKTGAPDKQIVSEENPVLAAECDLDKLFGFVTAIVDITNAMITDLFEIIEAFTANWEIYTHVIEGIPLFGELPIDDIMGLIDTSLENFAQNYDAYYTQALRDEYRCEIFCLAQSNPGCEFRFIDLMHYFGEKAIMEIVKIDLADIVEFITQGTFSGVEQIHVMHALVWAILSHGGYVMGVNMDWLMRALEASLNDPDSDHAVLCDPCSVPTWAIDHIYYSASWGSDAPAYASVVDEFGFWGSPDSAPMRGFYSVVRPGHYGGDTVLWLEVTLPYPRTLTSVTAYLGRDVAGGTWYEFYNGNSLVNSAYIYNSGAPAWVGNITVSHFRIRTQSAPNNWHILQRLEIEGEGTNPFA